MTEIRLAERCKGQMGKIKKQVFIATFEQNKKTYYFETQQGKNM